MGIYIIGNDGITLCSEAPAAVNEGEIVVASNEELHAAQLSGKRLLALWNALPGVEKRKKVGDRDALIDQLWSAVGELPDPDQPSETKRPSKQEAVIAMLQRPEGATVDEVASVMGWQRHTVRGALLRNSEEEAWADPRLSDGGARPGLSHRRPAAGMRRAIHDATACREALARLPKLGLGELRQQWRVLYKAEASPYLSRDGSARRRSASGVSF